MFRYIKWLELASKKFSILILTLVLTMDINKLKSLSDFEKKKCLMLFK